MEKRLTQDCRAQGSKQHPCILWVPDPCNRSCCLHIGRNLEQWRPHNSHWMTLELELVDYLFVLLVWFVGLERLMEGLKLEDLRLEDLIFEGLVAANLVASASNLSPFQFDCDLATRIRYMPDSIFITILIWQDAKNSSMHVLSKTWNFQLLRSLWEIWESLVVPMWSFVEWCPMSF